MKSIAWNFTCFDNVALRNRFNVFDLFNVLAPTHWGSPGG
jgi:hypothetical protein